MLNLIYHDVIQGTDAWLHVKAGKFSGTSASEFIVNGRSAGGIGQGLSTMIYKKSSDAVTGPDLDGYTSKSMQRGNDYEPYARKRYEVGNFVDVQEVGFIQLGSFFGVSPDGLVGEDGAIEIKCPGGPEWVRWKDTDMQVKDICSNYYYQMQWLMFITGRKWVDYVVFNPDFAPLDYTQTRVARDEVAMGIFEEKSKAVVVEMTRILNKVALKEAA